MSLTTETPAPEGLPVHLTAEDVTNATSALERSAGDCDTLAAVFPARAERLTARAAALRATAGKINSASPTPANITAAALTLDEGARLRLITALQDAAGQVPCVTLSAPDILDETRERMEEKPTSSSDAEEGDAEALPFLTLEMALDVCREVSEGDWTATCDEAAWRARRRLEARARAARDDAQRLNVIGLTAA